MSTSTTRDRAEELLHNLQKRAREWVDAEEGIGRTVKDLIEDKGLAPGEVKRRIEDVVGNMRGRGLWERVRTSEAVVALADYRDDIERRVEDSMQRLLKSLQIVTRTDLRGLEDDLTTLHKKVDHLKQEVSKRQAV